MFDFLKFGRGGKNHQNIELEDESPMDGEVFSLERLQGRAAELAATHRVAAKEKRGFNLLARLEDNKNELIKVYHDLSDTARDELLTPSAEWLVDNFHIVEEQLREVRQDLPLKFYRELPKLENGAFENYPRIYHLAYEVVADTDNRLDPIALEAFLDAYQQHKPLTIGEIWAFPISLRLALIENLTAPFYLHVATASIPPTESDRWKNVLIYFSNLWDDVKTIVTQMFFRFAFLAHEAALTIDAFAMLGEGDRAHEIFSLLNPVNHTRTSEDIARYKTEPYSVAADVYSNPQHVGRGGWTWYTGAAGWLYRAALENILGFTKYGDTLSIEPCIPREWKEFEIAYRYKSTMYSIKVEKSTRS